MRHLHIDIETFATVDLTKVGLYRYVEDPSFKIIIFAYSYDGVNFKSIDTYDEFLPGAKLPADVLHDLISKDVLKVAHNAAFEIACIAAYYGQKLDPRQWFCTMVGSAYLGLPFGLDKVAEVLGLDHKKDAAGKALIKYFSMPCKPTKANGGRTVNLPSDAPEKWEDYISYCVQDVRVECEIFKYLQRFPGLSALEWLYWAQDQQINANGAYTDADFIEAAIEANAEFMEGVRAEFAQLTGLENTNSPKQLKDWFSRELGEEVDGLAKEKVEAYLDSDHLPDHVRRAFVLRQLGSKTSISKYSAMQNYAGADGRIRGLFQFYGANRTGRWAGRGVQVQNLKRTMNKGVGVAREAVRVGVAALLYDDVAQVLSQLIRTAIVAKPGYLIVTSDYSAVEARILAWLAGETWVLDVFNTHGLLYESTAAKMFNVPMEAVGPDLRQKGKVAALALGYQGASGALVAMGALRQGLTEEELPPIVRAWRAANPAIVKFWYECDRIAKHVIEKKTSYILRKPFTTLTFSYDKGYLFITLPSGRRLSYFGAHVAGRSIVYYGMDQVKKIWVKIDTYGGSLVENITQAVARDCLVEAMYTLRRENIIMHIHDEIVFEEPEDDAEELLRYVNSIMAVSPAWAEGLPLAGAGYVSKYYKKD